MPNSSRSTRRTRLLKRARTLARSGHHASVGGVIAALGSGADVNDVGDWLVDARLVEQLNLLCLAARSGTAA